MEKIIHLWKLLANVIIDYDGNNIPIEKTLIIKKETNL
jgi:hypothetical protein